MAISKPEGFTPLIAKVALSIPYSLPFDYLLPEWMKNVVKPGCRLLVPLGNQKVSGYLVETKTDSSVSKLRPVICPIDENPLITPELLSLCRWMASYYLCSLGEILEAAIPSGLTPRLYSKPAILHDHLFWRGLTNTEIKSVVELLGSGKLEGIDPEIELLAYSAVAKKAVSYFDFKYDFEVQDYRLSLNEIALQENKVRKGTKAEKLIELIRKDKDCIKSKLLTQNKGFRPVLKKLLEQIFVTEHPFNPQQSNDAPSFFNDRFLELNLEQVHAFGRINPWIKKGEYKAFLLQGVTGSGKTEVYLHAVRECLRHSRTALILLPEIALTPQAISRFEQRFGDEIAVLHSGMSDKKRSQNWYEIHKGLKRIVIGARSAVFAPLQNIGLIVVDEEHDQSYKQQESPFYQARDLAVKIAQNEKAVILLGSATPSIESYKNVTQSKYELLTLLHRANQKPLPKAKILDLKIEPRHPGVFYLSKELMRQLKDNLEQNKQAILFLNRRGYASFLTCKSCQEPVLCRDCSIAMTWHKDKRSLCCHHCHFEQGYPQKCESCGFHEFRYEGIGTQRVETDLKRLFPQARFLRMDRDSIRKKGSLEEGIQKIKNHEVDFIIGTQLISKGHDFEKIGLVCILLADMGLNVPDFRSSERIFQLVFQVSGRSGRSKDPDDLGYCLIQTYNPDHYAIHTASENDLQGFVAREMETRQSFFNPPFSKMILIKISDPDPQKAKSLAQECGQVLLKTIGPEDAQVLGPAPAPIEKVNNRFYWQIIIKATRMQTVKHRLFWLFFESKAIKRGSKGRVTVDVDPFHMM